MTLAFQLAVLLSITQSLLVSIGLIRIRKLQSHANSYLAIAILSIAIAGLCVFLDSLSLDTAWFTTLSDVMWEFIFPGAFILYFAQLLNHPLASQKRRWLVFSPFLLTLIINLVIDASHELKLYELPFREDNASLQSYYGIESICTVLFALLGIGISYRIVSTSQQDVAFLWAKEFWRWSSAVTLIWIVFFCFDNYFLAGGMTFVWIGFIAFISFIIYRGILQYQLIHQRLDVKVARQTTLQSSAEKDEVSRELSLIADRPTNVANHHLRRLEQLMHNEFLFRNPMLSRKELAALVGISGGHLTKLLSEHKAMSFTAYVNMYRIDDVKRMLLDEKFDHLSLLAIGLEAGFNSKSAFYSSFRKATGLSPSSFRQAAENRKH